MRLQVDLASACRQRAEAGIRQHARIVLARDEWRIVPCRITRDCARVASDIRNIESFGKLQARCCLRSPTYPPTFVTAGFNKLGYWEALKNLGKVATG